MHSTYALQNRHGACFITEEEKKKVFLSTYYLFDALPFKMILVWSKARCCSTCKESHTNQFHGLKFFLKYPAYKSGKIK